MKPNPNKPSKSNAKKASAPTLGRPSIPMPLPAKKSFTIESIFNQLQKRADASKRLTRVAVGLKISKEIKNGKVKLIGKRPPAKNLGQPVKIFQCVN